MDLNVFKTNNYLHIDGVFVLQKYPCLFLSCNADKFLSSISPDFITFESSSSVSYTHLTLPTKASG